MAGSYRHITNPDGTFRGLDLIENLGDAHEALEECWYMIQWLARSNRELIYKAWLEGYFKGHCPPENLPLATYERFWYD